LHRQANRTFRKINQKINNSQSVESSKISLDKNKHQHSSSFNIANKTSCNNLTKGNPLHNKEKGTTRLLTGNANSLRPNNNGKYKGTIERICELEADLIGLCETCINWDDDELQPSWKRIMNKKIPGASIVASTTSQKHKGRYLPGGTMTITTGSWTSLIENQIYDCAKMGRWTGAQYSLSDDKKLILISAYRVCQGSAVESASLSTYNQQFMMMKTNGVKEPDPRKQFVDDFIMQFKKTCLDVNKHIIITLDANSTLGEDPTGMDKIMKECELIDMYSEIHQDNTQFGTHQNGTKRIDYILCSRNTIKHITRMGYLKFNEGIDSDHRCMYCNISDSIKSSTDYQVPMKKSRIVGSNSTNKEGEQYIRGLDKYFQYHQIYEKVNELYELRHKLKNSSDKVKEELDKLDGLITGCKLKSEKTYCKKKYKTLYTPQEKQVHALMVDALCHFVGNVHQK
jgi:exonuclease III